jgi:hypothetical protein
MRWVSVKDRLPDEYKNVFLIWVYPNHNTGYAVGYLDNGEWQIEWSDDHPSHKDIARWLDDVEELEIIEKQP